MKPIRRILFAIKNTSTRRHAALDKAVQIAKCFGADLELFNAISTPVFGELQPLTGTSLGELKREAHASRMRDLNKLAERARVAGVGISCAVAWDFPPHEAIVRHAIRTGTDLVIAEVHEGGRLKPWLMHLTDWELLRMCPVPVLIFKNSQGWRQPVVLAAVDPSHAHAKPIALDRSIVDNASRLAASAGGTLHVVHASHPPIVSGPRVDAGADDGERHDFDALATAARIPETRRHVVRGDPVVVIPKAARQLGADVVVMGAVSRSGLRRVFIGNTAERVLGTLPCDVLVVKPAHAAKAIPARPRGMLVVAASPVLPMHG